MNERLARPPSPTETDLVGVFGKVPTHGDFVSTAVGLRLQTALDQWMRSGLAALEPALGKDWRRLFHAAGPWRFVVGSGVWAPAAVAGIFLPSRDRVGRSFPLVIAAQLHGFSGKLRDLCEDNEWFAGAEALSQTAEAPDFDIRRFIDAVRSLRMPVAIERETEPASPSPPAPPASLWWRMTPGSRRGKGFRTGAAPDIGDFLRLVTTEAAPAAPPAVSPAPAGSTLARASARRISSSHASHPGTRLALNADALLVSEHPHLFAIADGVGDGMGAMEAARAATMALAGIAPDRTATELIQDAKAKLSHAHAMLRAKGTAGDREPPAASIVAIVLDGDAFALLWAGDARCYLLRDGLMRCLTRDHVDIGLRRVLSRGLGLKQQFLPEVLAGQFRAGDRLMLCSGALTRALPDRAVAETLLDVPVGQAAETLVQDALIANCRENVSIVVIGVD